LTVSVNGPETDGAEADTLIFKSSNQDRF